MGEIASGPTHLPNLPNAARDEAVFAGRATLWRVGHGA